MTDENEKAAPKETYGPATRNDIAWIWQHVHQAIDELEFYAEEFKAFEKQRMNMGFLTALFEHNPHHLLVLKLDGERAGFMVSGPDNGVVFLYWSYILPAFRKSRLAQKANKYWIEYFDNGEFHKASTFTRPENRTALIVLKRFGWKEAAHLEKHIFGEDYKIFEIPFTKTTKGYRPFVVKGRTGRLIDKLKRAFAG